MRTLYSLYREAIIDTSLRWSMDLKTFTYLLKDHLGCKAIMDCKGLRLDLEDDISEDTIQEAIEPFIESGWITRMAIDLKARRYYNQVKDAQETIRPKRPGLKKKASHDKPTSTGGNTMTKLILAVMLITTTDVYGQNEMNFVDAIYNLETQAQTRELLRLQVERARYMNGNGGAAPMRQGGYDAPKSQYENPQFQRQLQDHMRQGYQGHGY